MRSSRRETNPPAILRDSRVIVSHNVKHQCLVKAHMSHTQLIESPCQFIVCCEQSSDYAHCDVIKHRIGLFNLFDFDFTDISMIILYEINMKMI